MKNFLVRFTVALVLMLLGAPAALACSCLAFPHTLEEGVLRGVEEADAVFLARVTSMEDMEESRLGFPVRRVSFELLENFKGVEASDTYLVTNLSSAACGYSGFEVGAEFLVYASRNLEGELGTGLCQRTARSAGATDEIQLLREYIEHSEVGLPNTNSQNDGPACGQK
ncbi:hypothetical protein KR51_00014410 [Rubidibacter lacunae KORDI 51-2]|uniref:Tissue inhibitor of metalloproteinase n=1 Tax=Rubidibacter lacunae KORDI 51-2 TaxID=582515 RepID=U5DMR8_9CHRO|nr:hypothetical protein [Rubidibacter lacunae]ERN41909.1 hypothetical protein KR51_00014410 [Rubidibacter lacunae KORDI 51-2]